MAAAALLIGLAYARSIDGTATHRADHFLLHRPQRRDAIAYVNPGVPGQDINRLGEQRHEPRPAGVAWHAVRCEPIRMRRSGHCPRSIANKKKSSAEPF